jgi:hypothetical protein
MDARFPCPDDPERLFGTKVCLNAVSKDAGGDIRLLEDRQEECRAEECRTLKTMHLLHLQLSTGTGGCDAFERTLDGTLYTKDLVHAFTNGDSTLRGVHAGTFRWAGHTARAEGTLSGISNAGTHRGKPFRDCQRCDEPGWMEGRLCGSIVEADDPGLVGCQLIGTYRLQLEGRFSDPGASVRGTIEGLVVCACEAGPCIDFQGFPIGTMANPLTVQGVTFTRLDTSGNPTPNLTVTSTLGFTGLDCVPRTEIQLPPSSSITLELAHIPQFPPTVTAFLGTTPVPVNALQSTPSPMTWLRLATAAGSAADHLVIDVGNSRAKLLRLCFEPTT